MKTCSFGTYLEPGSIFLVASVSVSRRLVLSRRLLHSELRSYIELGSFSFCFGFSSPITSHFDFKCFVTKTSFRRSSGEKLCISSFGSSLALPTSSRKDICNSASLIWTGFLIVTFHSEVGRKQDLLYRSRLNWSSGRAFVKSSWEPSNGKTIKSVCLVRLVRHLPKSRNKQDLFVEDSIGRPVERLSKVLENLQTEGEDSIGRPVERLSKVSARASLLGLALETETTWFKRAVYV